MEIEKRLNHKGNLVIKLYKKESGIVGFYGKDRFKYKKTNMFLTEIHVNSPKIESREFIISIRKDGENNDCRMTQMNFKEQELIELKDSIDEMITYKNNKKHLPSSNNEFKEYRIWFKPY